MLRVSPSEKVVHFHLFKDCWLLTIMNRVFALLR